MWQKDLLLHDLKKKAARKDFLEKLISDLRKQESELLEKVASLDAVRLREQTEYERLAGRGLSAFFYAIVGKKEEKLAEEQSEAHAAQAKYDTAKRELEAVREDIAEYNAEYASLIGLDVRYEKLLDEKKEALKQKGSAEAERIIELEGSLAEAESREEEINDAICAAERAVKSADKVIDYLSHAEEWASWDILGGGMIVDAAKHDTLDAAQAAVEQLQVDLRRLKTELADIAEDTDIKVNVEGFLRFADWFFDGIFVDYGIFQRIEESKERIFSIRNKVKSLRTHLKDMLAKNEKRQAELTSELEKTVLDTEV
ncbi:MAG: hypothetical protein IKM32_05820 [Clostridia bacterium]|nr:hypothetical protein [Clostridia bacterium]